MSSEPLIAIIDDDEGVRVSLDGLVRSLGYRVATFHSAEAFLASDDWTLSRCVISDVNMPGGMTGIALADRLLRTSAVPVILISAFVDERTCHEASRAGVRRFLRKPFDGDVLIGSLEEALAS
ncbi:response regulator transcription factor [Sphingomonas sp. DT-51]|uniref:response regulator transcription factor n=1 Tax=Sphingomonas sp. DT-51 TaxID=3396165 RepID=UPI003F1ABE86